eukprot:jgi/Mesvir1/8674/Mv02614-RA.1
MGLARRKVAVRQEKAEESKAPASGAGESVGHDAVKKSLVEGSAESAQTAGSDHGAAADGQAAVQGNPTYSLECCEKSHLGSSSTPTDPCLCAKSELRVAVP